MNPLFSLKMLKVHLYFPQQSDFQAIYSQVKWLPTSASKVDPIYTMSQKLPDALMILRKQIILIRQIKVRYSLRKPIKLELLLHLAPPTIALVTF